MSNNLDPLSNPLNIKTIQEIDNLDLPINAETSFKNTRSLPSDFKNHQCR